MNPNSTETYTDLDPADNSQQLSPTAVSNSDVIAAAWIRYQEGTESITVGLFDAESLTPTRSPTILSDENTPHDPQTDFVGDNPIVLWIEDCEDKPDSVRFSSQCIRYSILRENQWSTPKTLVTGNSILSFDTASAGDSLWVVWCDSKHVSGNSAESIYCASLSPSEETIPHEIEIDVDVERPAIAANDDGCLVVYDKYSEKTHKICSAYIKHDDRHAPIRTVVANDLSVRQLSATATFDATGNAWAAWLTLDDVIDENGIVDQRPTIRASIYSGSSWNDVHDATGSADLADLSWGLLSYRNTGVWGYLGRRRKPLLVPNPAGNGALLLWERKADHDGPTASTDGLLCRRRLTGSLGKVEVSETSIIAAGPRNYEPVRATATVGDIPDFSTDRQEDQSIRHTVRFVGRAVPAESTARLILGSATSSDSFSESGSWNNWQSVVVNTLIKSQYGESAFPENPHPQLKPPYWADLHVHTGLSADAEGFVDEIINYAKDRADLDVVLLQDNDHYNLSLTEAEYRFLQRRANRYSVDNQFIVIPGFEWTYFESPDRRPSHRTVFGRQIDMPMLRNTESGSSPTDALAKFARENDAIVHIHHERFSLLPDGVDRNMEVCSGWKLHMANSDDRAFFHSLLKDGHRLGYVGGSDNHRRNPGAGGSLTGIFAESLNRDSIIDAIVNHRCFVTNGSRVIPRFEVSGGTIGSNIDVHGIPEIKMSVEWARPDSTIRLIRDGEPVFIADISNSYETFDFQDEAADKGNHYYYLEVVQDSRWIDHPSNLAPATGDMAWTSPIWINRL